MLITESFQDVKTREGGTMRKVAVPWALDA